MWDLALASPPSSPRLDPTSGPSTSYGTTEPVPKLSHTAEPATNPYAPDAGPSFEFAPSSTPRKRDKFAEGRVWSYTPLATWSAGAIIASGLVIKDTHYGRL